VLVVVVTAVAQLWPLLLVQQTQAVVAVEIIKVAQVAQAGRAS
jgi:hypothetical protein